MKALYTKINNDNEDGANTAELEEDFESLIQTFKSSHPETYVRHS